MTQVYRNFVLYQDGTKDETKFKKEEKDQAKANHGQNKVKLKKDEKASTHLCAHDPLAEGGPDLEWWDCRTDPRAEYEEFTKKGDLDLTDIIVALPGPTPPGG